ncbi:23S ribosomal RNA methyltransferase [Aspergillus campestris IBT 28561]|uniref:rRNA methyltransferase 2, mitochondrial n=1 Tax=Aspergillus campestris (strain IBT 28561) TaxID=1392248 RepID=A0A2I1CZ41_ASPC2|nr:23S ribosomal RNA methyltransferase [Aspergillus campestris IBT 28561]PKY02899.1 23S ribosomal RNA methyltransferase [Aspergillus campestris IBT 28561]
MFTQLHGTCVTRSQQNLLIHTFTPRRFASSKRWQARQLNDRFTREASAQGLKSRAAFKLLQIDEKFHIFKRGQTVVDLGYAPGSWSQVAVSRTQPGGRVLGVDIIPAQPPKGVSAIQGDFLDPKIQEYVLGFVRDSRIGQIQPTVSSNGTVGHNHSGLQTGLESDTSDGDAAINQTHPETQDNPKSQFTVDVVLSDMMMNTSGVKFKDHAGSMDLCRAALEFSFVVLKAGGHFICKFYQGAEDRALEKQLKYLFEKVHRLKPESSRSVRAIIYILSKK